MACLSMRLRWGKQTTGVQTNNGINQQNTYSASISFPSSFSGTARIYSTLLHLHITHVEYTIPNQNITQMSGALSVNNLLTSSQLQITAYSTMIPEYSYKRRRKQDNLRINQCAKSVPWYSSPHFSFTQTSFPVWSFKKGFGFTSSLIYNISGATDPETYNAAAHRVMICASFPIEEIPAVFPTLGARVSRIFKTIP